MEAPPPNLPSEEEPAAPDTPALTPGNRPRTPPRPTRLQRTIEATQRDWQHRQDAIARAYKVSADVFLDQSLLFLVPVLREEALVQQRAEQRPFSTDYYPWAKRWAPIVCSACYRPASQLLYGHGQGHRDCLS